MDPITPVAPADFGSIASDCSVAYYGVQMELLPSASSAGSGVADRLMVDFLSRSVGAPAFLRRSSEKEALRYPLWIPVHKAKNALDLVLSDGDYPTNFTIDGDVDVDHLKARIEAAASYPGDIWIPLPSIPMGAVVDRVRINMDSNSGPVASTLTYDIWEDFPRTSAAVNQWANSDFFMRRSESVSDPTPFASSMLFQLSQGPASGTNGMLHRNRVGQPWPTSVAHATVMDGASFAARLRPSQWWARVKPSATSGTWALNLYGVEVLYYVDARFPHGMFSQL